MALAKPNHRSPLKRSRIPTVMKTRMSAADTEDSRDMLAAVEACATLIRYSLWCEANTTNSFFAAMKGHHHPPWYRQRVRFKTTNAMFNQQVIATLFMIHWYIWQLPMTNGSFYSYFLLLMQCKHGFWMSADNIPEHVFLLKLWRMLNQKLMH